MVQVRRGTSRVLMTGETWYVTCLDGFWLGTVGNCTKFGMGHFTSRYVVMVFVVIVMLL